MQLTAAESSSLLDQATKVSVIEHVTNHRDSAATTRVDIVGYLARLLAIDIRNDNLDDDGQSVKDSGVRGEEYKYILWRPHWRIVARIQHRYPVQIL